MSEVVQVFPSGMSPQQWMIQLNLQQVWHLQTLRGENQPGKESGMKSPSNSLTLSRLPLLVSPSFPAQVVLGAILDNYGAILQSYFVVGEGGLLLDIQIPPAWSS